MSASRWFVRCVAGGCVIGSRDDDIYGQPLTKRTAEALAQRENEISARRREQKLGRCFDFYAQEVTPTEGRAEG